MRAQNTETDEPYACRTENTCRDWKFYLGKFGFGNFGFGIFNLRSLGSLAWDLYLRICSLDSFAWELSFVILRLGNLGVGGWENFGLGSWEL